MPNNMRCFRRKEINFDTAMELISKGNRIGAKREIEKLFRGITNVEVGYGILKLIEESGSIPNNDELTLYITQKEEENSSRKLQTSITKANTARTQKANTVIRREQHVPKCPTCGSTDLIKQGVTGRAVSGFIFGTLSVEGRAQFVCKNCGYKF